MRAVVATVVDRLKMALGRCVGAPSRPLSAVRTCLFCVSNFLLSTVHCMAQMRRPLKQVFVDDILSLFITGRRC